MVDVLRRAVAAGDKGCPTPSGEAGPATVLELERKGLLRWEQKSPFVAWMWATDRGRAALAGRDGKEQDGGSSECAHTPKYRGVTVERDG